MNPVEQMLDEMAKVLEEQEKLHEESAKIVATLDLSVLELPADLMDLTYRVARLENYKKELAEGNIKPDKVMIAYNALIRERENVIQFSKLFRNPIGKPC